MKRIKITYPQITFESKTIEVSDSEAEDLRNSCLDERVEFMWNNMDDGVKDWCPDGKKGLTSALDMEYASIKTL